MNKIMLNVVAFCLVAQLATAQIRLPQPSPGATVVQTIGTTDVTVKYSRPAMRGREIFGTLVPYGQLWRTGANAATTLAATTDLFINGQRLPAGTYSVFTIPAQNEWTLVLNKNTGASADAYKQEEDALRVRMQPQQTSDRTESFTIHFTDVTDSTAKLNFMWANVKAAADLRVDVKTNAQANVERAVADKPEDPAVLQAAAAWNLAQGRNLEQALAWTDKSIGLKETFRNVWTKAQIMAKMGKAAEAVTLAQRAMSIGQTSNDPAFPFFKDAIQKGITDYQAMVPPVPAKGKKKKTS
ncbi:hypothetical protein GCM10023189_13570 [Nibrella saemangeumensis]|uniref:DUF2911 domain-containing protein n=1 Tax=Nibrella saemangeumensis TaxID=1084526 RepID=A0ABP8MLW1_9BACT